MRTGLKVQYRGKLWTVMCVGVAIMLLRCRTGVVAAPRSHVELENEFYVDERTLRIPCVGQHELVHGRAAMLSRWLRACRTAGKEPMYVWRCPPRPVYKTDRDGST